jgi:hypothetical protein
MSAASDLIERAEREVGVDSWDDPKNPGAIRILLGAVAREMGVNPHKEREDYAVGILLAEEIENGAENRRRDEAMIALLMLGVPPDALR